jgi:hypothetical protein
MVAVAVVVHMLVATVLVVRVAEPTVEQTQEIQTKAVVAVVPLVEQALMAVMADQALLFFVIQTHAQSQ